MNSLSDGIDLKQVRVQSASARVDHKDVEDKFDQLLREIGKLQEQLAAISSQANGSLGSGQTTIHMHVAERWRSRHFEYQDFLGVEIQGGDWVLHKAPDLLESSHQMPSALYCKSSKRACNGRQLFGQVSVLSIIPVHKFKLVLILKHYKIVACYMDCTTPQKTFAIKVHYTPFCKKGDGIHKERQKSIIWHYINVWTHSTNTTNSERCVQDSKSRASYEGEARQQKRLIRRYAQSNASHKN